MTRLSVIDIGTQSVLHAITEFTKDGRAGIVTQRTEAVRLGRNIAATARIGTASLERLIHILNLYREEAAAAGCTRTVAAGTRVFRVAENRDAVLEAVHKRTGVTVEVLSEEQEAALGFYGATYEVCSDESITVIDIGGGSTEIVRGRAGKIYGWQSLPAGAVTLTESGERSPVDLTKLLPVRGELLDSSQLIGIGGTVTTLAALDIGLTVYDSRRVEGYSLTVSAVERIIDALEEMPPAHRRILAAIDPERADILPAGARILTFLLRTSGKESVAVHDRGLRFGIALREFGII